MVANSVEAGAFMPLVPTEEERSLRSVVAGVAKKYGPDYFQKHGKSKTPMHEIWQELGELGLLSVHMPEEYGGGGAGLFDLGAVAEECAAAGVPQSHIVSSLGVVSALVLKHGTEAQRKEWLPRLTDGSAVFAFGITEPDAGSNSHNIATTARRDGDDFLIRGQKYFTSGMEEAEKVIVVARTGEDDRNRGRLTLFALDVNAPGISRTPIEVAVEVPEQQWNVFYDDVRATEADIVGELDQGLKTMFAGLNPERIMAGFAMVGIGRYALNKAVDYTSGRSVWGKPLATHQAVAHPLAESFMELEAARTMLRKAALLHDSGEEAGEAANIAKFLACDAAHRAVERAIHVHGGNGMATEYQLSNYLFITRSNLVAPVSREMVLNFVGQHSLGLPRSY